MEPVVFRECTCSHCGYSVESIQFANSSLLLSLRSGVQPSEQQCTLHEDELRSLQACAVEQQAEIRRLKESLKILRTALSRTQKDIDRRSCLVHSPIRRRPAEILSLIFYYAWPGHKGRFPIPAKIKAAPPPSLFAVPSVCTYWRELAGSLSAIQSWRKLDLDAQDWRALRHVWDADIKASPRMRITGCFGKNRAPNAEELAGLAHYSSGWREIELESCYWPTEYFIGTETPLPKLESLVYIFSESRRPKMPASAYGKRMEAMATHCPGLFVSAPALRRVSLYSDACGPVPPLPFSLPWHQLTELTVSADFVPDPMLDILTHCSTLQSLTVLEEAGALDIAIYFWDLEDEEGDAVERMLPPVRQTCVFHGHKLTIKMNRRIAVMSLLRALTAPSLAELNLTLDHLSSIEMRSVVDFLSRSGCTLIRLKIWWRYWDSRPRATPCDGLLSCASHLQHLHIKLGASWQNVRVRTANLDLIDGLCKARESLSHLRVLKLVTCQHQIADDKVLSAVLPTLVNETPVREVWLREDLLKRVSPHIRSKVDLYGVPFRHQ